MNLRILAFGANSSSMFGGLSLEACRTQIVALRAGDRGGTAIRSILQKEADTGFSTGTDFSRELRPSFGRRSAEEWLVLIEVIDYFL